MSFLQVHKEFKALTPVSLSSYCIYRGAAYEPQESPLQSGIDILVGTPGRILDHVTRGTVDLSGLRSVGGSEAYTVTVQQEILNFSCYKIFCVKIYCVVNVLTATCRSLPRVSYRGVGALEFPPSPPEILKLSVWLLLWLVCVV